MFSWIINSFFRRSGNLGSLQVITVSHPTGFCSAFLFQLLSCFSNTPFIFPKPTPDLSSRIRGMLERCFLYGCQSRFHCSLGFRLSILRVQWSCYDLFATRREMNLFCLENCVINHFVLCYLTYLFFQAGKFPICSFQQESLLFFMAKFSAV